MPRNIFKRHSACTGGIGLEAIQDAFGVIATVHPIQVLDPDSKNRLSSREPKACWISSPAASCWSGHLATQNEVICACEVGPEMCQDCRCRRNGGNQGSTPHAWMFGRGPSLSQCMMQAASASQALSQARKQKALSLQLHPPIPTHPAVNSQLPLDGGRGWVIKARERERGQSGGPFAPTNLRSPAFPSSAMTGGCVVGLRRCLTGSDARQQ
jgi:hypothetical protein